MLKQLFYRGPPRKILHEQYAKQGRIDEQAPVQTASSIDIGAPIEQVWQRLVNFPAWPTISPAFRNVRLEGTVVVDAGFRFTLNHVPIRATFAVVEPGRALIWTGTFLWFNAVDLYTLEPTTAGGTRLTLAESLAGALALLFTNSTQIRLQHERWLVALKRAVEDG